VTHKPLYVNPLFLRPLPETMRDMACSKCDKRQSQWEFVPSDAPAKSRGGFPICSLCWLYESDWGVAREEDIAAMIRSVEQSTNKVLQRAKGGRLWSCKDADAILSSVVVTSRIWAARELAAARDGRPG
jgi:hypothetical protein